MRKHYKFIFKIKDWCDQSHTLVDYYDGIEYNELKQENKKSKETN